MENNFDNDPNGQYTDPNAQNVNDQYGESNGQYGNDQYGNANGNYGSDPYGNTNDPYGNNQYNDPNAQFNYGQGNSYGVPNGTYGGYSNLGGAPLDKHGNPIPNRFGMKLTFSILEIISLIFCNLIAFIMGIVSCVFTCKANTAYKEGRWDEFKSSAKTATICLWIGFATNVIVIICYIILFVIGYAVVNQMIDDPEFQKEVESILSDDEFSQYFGDDYDDYEEYDFYGNEEFTDPSVAGEYYSMTLEGVNFTLPVTVSDLIAAGFTFDDADLDGTMINADDYEFESIYSAEGMYLGYVSISNLGETAIAEQDAVVTGVDIYDGDIPYGGTDAVDFTLGNGITFGMTIDELTTLLGEPYYRDDDDTDNDDFYQWYIGDDYDNTIYIWFTDGIVNEISVEYDPD